MQTWQPDMKLVGELRASRGADLALQVSGIVQTLSFESGDTVQAGAALLQLVADDLIAKLDSLKATAELNALTLKRDTEQLKIKSVSEATVENDQANLKNSRALVAQQQALVAQYGLTAPFAGRLGIRSVDLGQYLSAGTTIVTLQALDPLFADFYVPQQYFGRLQVGQPVKLQVDSYAGQVFAGTVSAINAKVESGSRNVKVRAELKNPQGRLVPGMFQGRPRDRRGGTVRDAAADRHCGQSLRLDRFRAGQGRRRNRLGGARDLHQDGTGARRPRRYRLRAA